MEGTAQRMTTAREQLANSVIPVPKENLRIVTLADRWTSADCCIGDSCASSHELTRSEKLVALVQLLRSHWISAEHYCLEYLERLTATDPDLYFVALRDGTPVGMPIYSEMITCPNSRHSASHLTRAARSNVLVLTFEGMIGAIRGDDEATCFNISSFVVRSDLRRGGIGRVLWQRVWDELRAQHAASHPGKELLVSLSTGRKNPMRGFYERAGFRRLGPPTCISDPTLESPWDTLYWKGINAKCRCTLRVLSFDSSY